MKTLRMVGIVMMAVSMGVGFTSCGKDDNPAATEKKLTQITYSDSDTVMEFTYDNKGRVIEVFHYEKEGYYVERMVWNDGTVTSNTQNSWDYEDGDIPSNVYFIKNGLVQSMRGNEGGYTRHTYNQSNRLIEYNEYKYYEYEYDEYEYDEYEYDEYEYDTYKKRLIWDGDKLVSVTENQYDMTLTYGTSCKHGYNPLLTEIIRIYDSFLYMAQPELLGLRTKQLPTTITERYDDDESDYSRSHTAHFSYEFDKDGYISKITINESLKNSDGEVHTYTSSCFLTWE